MTESTELPRAEREALEAIEKRVGVYSGAVRNNPALHRIIGILDVLSALVVKGPK
jgi:hypothetical protein